jgi:sulfur-oxidizing protein SoxA
MIALALLAAPGSARPADIPLDQRRSGYADLSRDSKAMQDDDTVNPATLWVLDGEAIWNQKAGAAGRSCFDCHGDAAVSMKGVAARYPAFSPAQKGPIDLDQRIEHQQATQLPFESHDVLALATYVGRQSRGLPIAEANDDRLKPFIDVGRELFTRRQGQINLSCAQCHDDNWGKRIAGALLPQGHPNGYPLYRFEWQGVGSLQRRLRNCLFGIRAEVFPFGSSELVALELFLRQRARGMTIETPAVRP